MSQSISSSRLLIARAVVAAGLLLIALVAPAHAASGSVVVLTAEGVVDNVMAGYLKDGIGSAESAGAAAVVIRLNTPGGSLDSMTEITQAELDATIPVIVWVAPAGGWAASAGTFIALAGNLTYMAPGSSIGAASPVDANGNDITGTEGQKVKSFATSMISSIAETRGRNVTWAASAVQSAVSATAAEAVKAGVVDGIASSLQDVLAAAQGRQVTTKAGPVTVDVAGKPIVDASMNLGLSLLHLLADPNIAFVLFVVGLAGIIIEFVHPTLVAGIFGGLSLILAFIGFGSLPLNVAGLLLIGFGMLLFLLETQITSHGLLTLGGVIALVLGASVLYRPSGGNPLEPAVGVAWPVILTAAVATGVFGVGITFAAMRIRRMPAPREGVGTGLPIGTEGVVKAPIAPLGTAYLRGETWSARSVDGSEIARDTRVRLVAMDRLVAVVAPVTEAPQSKAQTTTGTSPATVVPPAGHP
ncbi:MAG TPA: NfeD family protein [Candidatus Limnocylindrales bacterium]